jgi:hypothetical protein
MKRQSPEEIASLCSAMRATHLRFQIEFAHTSENWRGRVKVFIGDSPDPLGRGLNSIAPKRPVKQNEKLSIIDKARRTLAARHYPGIAKPISDGGFKTDQDFQRWFIEAVKSWLLERATKGEMFGPMNYTDEFWTSDFIKRLAKRLARKRNIQRDFGLETLDRWLIQNWIKPPTSGNSFADMDRYELFEQVKILSRFFSKPLTPTMVWQRAYRLGLFSNRPPGPKPGS